MSGHLVTEVMRAHLKRIRDRVRKWRAIEKDVSTSLVGLLVGLFYVSASVCGSYLILYSDPPEVKQLFPWVVAAINAGWVILLKGRNTALLSKMYHEAHSGETTN
jgi:hypothetical protein